METLFDSIPLGEVSTSMTFNSPSAILLAYYGGLTYLQVAATLGIAEGTAKSRLRQALRSLAARLAKEGVLEK